MDKLRPCVDHVYQRLMKALAQAFYQDWFLMFPEDQALEPTLPNKRKKAPSDFTGLAVVVMDALICKPWWKEDELADLLYLPLRAARKMLRLWETHGLIAREHRKTKRRKRERAGQEAPEEEEDENDMVQENDQGLIISWSSIDYQRAYDVTRLRIHKMRQSLKAELEDRKSIQEFKCPECDPPKIYSTLNAKEIMSKDGFRCPECTSMLEAVDQEDGDKALSRKERRKKVLEKQTALEEALKPLVTILAEIEHLTKSGDESIPDFGTLNHHIARETQREQELQGVRRPGTDNAPTVNINIGAGQEEEEVAAAASGPREMPWWLKNQQQPANGHVPETFTNGASSSDQLKIDIQKQEEDEYMKNYNERLLKMKAEKQEPISNHAGGWEEVGLVDGSTGKTEVKEEVLATSNEPGSTNLQTETAGDDEADDDEWEDA